MHHNSCMLVSLAHPSTLHRMLNTTPVDPPAPPAPQGKLSNFIGEDPLPAPITSDQPSRRAPNPHIPTSDTTAGSGGSKSSSPPDPSVWSTEQQQQFLQALLSGAPPPRTFDVNAQVSDGAVPDDPLLALLSSMGMQGGMGQGAKVAPQSRTEPKPKTAIQKLLPLLHVIAVWALLAFFIFWREPEAFQARNSVVVSSGNIWNRWAKLASGTAAQSTWGIEIVVSLRPVATAKTVLLTCIQPFFWAFVSLELALSSTRIFFDFVGTPSAVHTPR